MSIDVTCPQCGQAYQVPDDKAGKKFRCKQCQEVVPIPGPGAAEEDSFDAPPPPRRRSAAVSESIDEDDDDEGIPNPLRSRRSNGGSGGSRRRKRRQSSSGSTAGPAIGMYIVTVLSVIWWVFFMFTIVISEPGDAPPDMDHETYMAINLIFGSAQLLFSGVILFGAYQLHSQQSKTLAMIAAVLCCIPCCSPCGFLGIPIGIWALVAINADGAFASSD